MLTENLRETSASMQSRIDQLEETVLELYKALCPAYGTIDFAQAVPEELNTPYSTHSVPIPGTNTSVTLITTPPHLVIGTPASHTPGPLQWEHELRIEFPAHTTFVTLGYGGETGDVQWFGADGSGHLVPALSALIAPGQIGHFYLARHEGIAAIQLTGTGRMYLTTLTVGMSTRVQSFQYAGRPVMMDWSNGGSNG
jgi:hypothetical protein